MEKTQQLTKYKLKRYFDQPMKIIQLKHVTLDLDHHKKQQIKRCLTGSILKIENLEREGWETVYVPLRLSKGVTFCKMKYN